MSPLKSQLRLYLLTAVFAVAILISYNSHSAGKGKAVTAAAKPDTPTTAHQLYYDTSYCPSLGTPEEFIKGMDKEQRQDMFHSAQYRIWLKRKLQMRDWRRQYAVLLQLPKDGKVIDVATFATPKGPRTIVAWMTALQTSISLDDVYTCPQVSQGMGYFHGKLRFSLVDMQAGKLLNTVLVTPEPQTFQHGDTVEYDVCDEHMDYPFSIANPKKQSAIGGLNYAATGGTDSTDGEAQILKLRDFNNDGKAYELALFRQESCVLTESTLVGYNEQSDQLKWYSWHMSVKENTDRKTDTAYTEDSHWMDHTMRFRFNKKSSLRYSMDYRGRDGALLRYDLHYDRATDTYSGMLDMRELPEDSLRRYGWYTLPEQDN